ncbi:hypothetical protein [Endozoicomonas sp. 8E]|uniref:hypothetical protein n=1 Tax=Endozoicomonas sp. 8E TaxID=3035692 RepID=UPI002938F7A5|nr:hypothetical protein [Endozoicomonas sp. 8E]WOG26913.1 hypothetical protein P6910_20545 [Endozoicomonas sp. 8E]
MSLICQAEPWTGRFTVELEQNEYFPNQSFSIKCGQPAVSGKPSGIASADACFGSASPSDDKRHKPECNGITTILIDSISSQWFYSTNLLVAYELTLTTKDAALSANPYSWLPLETFVAVGWLLKSYWSPGSPLLNTMEQQGPSMLSQVDNGFSVITVMFNSGHNQQQGQPSESSRQQAPAANNQPTGSFARPLHSDFGGGSQSPEQNQHTLSLNCFVHPCYGVCKFRQTSESAEAAEWQLNILESLTSYTEKTPKQSSCPHLAGGYCFSCMDHFDPVDPEQTKPFKTINDLADVQFQCNSGQLFQAYGSDSNPDNSCDTIRSMSTVAVCIKPPAESLNLQSLSEEAGIPYTVNQTGIPQERVTPENALSGITHCYQALSCDVKMVGEDGQRLCGRLFKNAQTLSNHKNRCHTGQKSCTATIVGNDGLQQPCGRLFKNVQALSTHKQRYHTGQKNCNKTVVGNDGNQHPCGMAFKNAQALADHKRLVHTGQRICNVILVREDGLQQPCGRVCKNSRALSDHRSVYHTSQRACSIIVFGEDGLQRPCGKLCRNNKSLSDHKRSVHSGQKTCDVIEIGEDGRSSPCGKICTSAKTLEDHRRKHRKRKPASVVRNKPQTSKSYIE